MIEFAEQDATLLEPATDQRVATLPPFKVILHNDDVNDFEHVILTVMKLTTLKAQEAAIAALEAHETGQSVLLITHRERAELYCEQFNTFGITVTSEPDV
ncbi:MAG: ATP-dependent Clp protease adaptor ClpS [Phycisphaerae bacterium]